MNETQLRERLFDLAADAPQAAGPPVELLRRARRRALLTIASSTAVALVLVAAGIAGVRWFAGSAPTPAVPPAPTPVDRTPSPDGSALPDFRTSGDVLDFGRGDLGGDLAAVDPTTGRSRTLVDGAEVQGSIGGAAWSPDGRYVAYVVQACAPEAGLWVVTADGGPRRVATIDCFLEPWAWSLDGAHLAIVRSDTLFLVDPSTGRETSLGAIGDELLAGPVWSPDGTRVVYSVPGPLYSVDVRTGDRSVLVQLQDAAIYQIDWSPDGAHLAIVAYMPAPRLYLMNADGSDLRLVDDNVGRGWSVPTPDPSTVTAWSPDGTRLAYSDFSGPNDRELRIWTVSLDGAPSLIASHTNPVCCQSGGFVVWSPDGSQIAFDAPIDQRETQQVYLAVDADGTGGSDEIDELTFRSWQGGWYFCFCYG